MTASSIGAGSDLLMKYLPDKANSLGLEPLHKLLLEEPGQKFREAIKYMNTENEMTRDDKATAEHVKNYLAFLKDDSGGRSRGPKRSPPWTARLQKCEPG